MTELTAEIARELLRYEPETGKLFWRKRDRKWFDSDRDFGRWNTRFANNEAFYTDSRNGYLNGFILGKQYRSHRVIWLMQTGSWPRNQIDHINQNRSDNCWSNLRDVSLIDNLKNQRKYKNNKSGIVGVHWHKRSRRWRAQISLDGRQTTIGDFVKKSDAIKARKAAEKQHGFHPNHGRPL